MSNESKLIRRKGSFKCVSGAIRVFSVLLLAVAFALAAVFVISLFNFGSDINLIIRRISAVLIVVEGALVAVRVIASLGREYTYEAGDTDFVVTDSYGEKEYFYYNDVSEVKYTEITRKDNICGYVVEIITGFRAVKYRFHFGSNAENVSTAATPFYCLEVNAGLREPENLPADSGQIMAQFERMQHHQDIERKKSTRSERESRLLESIQNNNQPIAKDKNEE